MKKTMQAISGVIVFVLCAALLFLLTRGFNSVPTAPAAQPLQSPIQTPDLTLVPTIVPVLSGTPPPLGTIIPPSTLFPPTWTVPPVPTPLPTPAVTPIPIAQPPFIPPLPGATDKPYTLIVRDGNVLRSIRSDTKAERVLIDVRAQLSLGFVHPKLTWAAPSPDGKQLALMLRDDRTPEGPHLSLCGNYKIYLLDIATGTSRSLVEGGAQPVWSPDGTMIAYCNTRTAGLWIVNTTTLETKELFAVDQTNLDYIVVPRIWIPDGKRIAASKSARGDGQ